MSSVHWKKCKEECDLCVEFCPAKALTLVPYDEASPSRTSPSISWPARSADRVMQLSPC